MGKKISLRALPLFSFCKCSGPFSFPFTTCLSVADEFPSDLRRSYETHELFSNGHEVGQSDVARQVCFGCLLRRFRRFSGFFRDTIFQSRQ